MPTLDSYTTDADEHTNGSSPEDDNDSETDNSESAETATSSTADSDEDDDSSLHDSVNDDDGRLRCKFCGATTSARGDVFTTKARVYQHINRCRQKPIGWLPIRDR